MVPGAVRRGTGTRQELHVVEQREFSSDHRPNRELQRHRPVRVYESHGATRHGVEPKSDPHRELKRDFAQDIADVLDEDLSHKRFDRLIIVAPPMTLGDLTECTFRSRQSVGDC